MTGWSIADDVYWRPKDDTDWQLFTDRSYKMEIHGYAFTQSEQSEIDAHSTGPLTQSEIDAYSTDPLPAEDNPPEIRQKASRHQQLREDGVLPTISVSGCQDANGAVFTFSRNGPTTENLAFTFSVDGGNTTISMGFGAGNATREWRAPFNTWVKIEKAYHNYHSGDYIVGTSGLVTANPWEPPCPSE